MKVIFLDIDGVLNDHWWDDNAQSTTIKDYCIKNLNRIIRKTDAKIVLSSAWRYMILNGAITFKGFEYLLRTHGLLSSAQIIGTTISDEETIGYDQQDKSQFVRPEQIKDFLSKHPEIENYVILDDMSLGLENHIKTDGQVGLTEEKADLAIKILLEQNDLDDISKILGENNENHRTS